MGDVLASSSQGCYLARYLGCDDGPRQSQPTELDHRGTWGVFNGIGIALKKVPTQRLVIVRLVVPETVPLREVF